MSGAAINRFCHILHRSGPIKGREGPMSSLTSRGVGRAGRAPGGWLRRRPPHTTSGRARPRVEPASAPPCPAAPTRSARGRGAGPGPLPPRASAGARRRIATPEPTSSCVARGRARYRQPARPGLPASCLSGPTPLGMSRDSRTGSSVFKTTPVKGEGGRVKGKVHV